MKVSEKSLELNVGAELLQLMRNSWGLPKAYLRGLTQAEENQEGVDFFAQLDPATRIFAFQFKAPRGKTDSMPYRYTLVREQHELLFSLAQTAPGCVLYVFPFYVTPGKLQSKVPQLLSDTWLADVVKMPTASVFGTTLGSRTIRCTPGLAKVNPTYALQKASEVSHPTSRGISTKGFVDWYGRHFQRDGAVAALRRNPWIARGLRVAIVVP